MTTIKESYSFADLFIGHIPGTIGEVSVIALLIGVAYLLIRRVINLRTPIAYILTVAVFVFVFGEHDPSFVLFHILGGGLIFGAFFMATDYTTTPITPNGQNFLLWNFYWYFNRNFPSLWCKRRRCFLCHYSWQHCRTFD